MIKIIWAKRAKDGLQKIYEYIEEDSPQNAEIIINEIVEKVTALKEQAERYKLDEYKKNNNGNYRAFEHKKIRVSYKIREKQIDIVRVRHTKKKPSKY
jgi:addiction module RelE/StbE family toxin